MQITFSKLYQLKKIVKLLFLETYSIFQKFTRVLGNGIVHLELLLLQYSFLFKLKLRNEYCMKYITCLKHILSLSKIKPLLDIQRCITTQTDIQQYLLKQFRAFQSRLQIEYIAQICYRFEYHLAYGFGQSNSRRLDYVKLAV